MYFFSTLLPYTYLISTVDPPSLGFGNLDGLAAPNDPNSLATGPDLAIDDQHLWGLADETNVRPAGGGSSIEPIVIPNAENLLDEEEVEAVREFFEQAGSNNMSLEPWARAFFLRREDVFGLAVALPGLLTDDQWNWIIGRPPPSIVQDAIRAEYGLDSVADVFKRVHEDVDSLTERQFSLLFGNFHPIKDSEFDSIGGSLFASVFSDRAVSADGIVRAACNNLLHLEGIIPAVRKASSVHHSRERRQVRRQRNRQRIRDLKARSPEEAEAAERDCEERREVWMAGAAAREERQAEWCRWEQASSKLSDFQIAEMRRLQELGPEAVQQSFLESLGLAEGGIESGEART